MNDESQKSSRIRRVPESEKKGRVWPDKSQQASNYPGMLNPDVNKKDPIHSVLTALPVLMLLIGLLFWYQKDRAQKNSSPLIAEAVELVGEFNGVSTTQSASGKQYFVWLMQSEYRKTIRLTKDQHAQYREQEVGGAVSITAAPTVSGSDTLWLVDIQPR